MGTTARPVAKPLIWVGDSLEMLRSFPEAVKDELGVALYHAQLGGKHNRAKPLHDIGSGVLEVVSDYRPFAPFMRSGWQVASMCFTHFRRSQKQALRLRNLRSI